MPEEPTVPPGAEQLTVSKIMLSKLFSDQYRFDLPWYQRAYAWTIDHAKCLLADVREAIANKEPWYHLGLIVLAKSDDDPHSMIVDGQQRIVSLTLLFAVLRDLTDDPDLKKTLNDRIWLDQGANEAHLKPQDTIENCLAGYVRAEGATAIEPDDIAAGDFNSNEQHVIENRDALREVLLEECGQPQLMEIAEYLVYQCHVVAQVVSSEDMAVRLFIKAQQSALELSPADMLKADMLSCAAADDRDLCSNVWNNAAARLGRAGFSDCLDDLRDIAVLDRPSKPVAQDLIEKYDIEGNAKHFVVEVLKPAAECSIGMRDFSMGTGGQAIGGEVHAAINRRLQYLGEVSHTEWRAPALHWLLVHGVDHKNTLDFLCRLEAFAYVHMLASTLLYRRQTEYYAVLKGVEDLSVLNDNGPLRVTNGNVKKARLRLMRPNFGRTTCKREILFRLNADYEGDSEVAPILDPSTEHVLPQNPPKRGKWKKEFPDKKTVAAFVQRLGNVTSLTGPENGDAGNNDFDVKCKIYKTSQFAMARDLPKHKNWTKKTIEQRTLALIDRLFKAWRLIK